MIEPALRKLRLDSRLVGRRGWIGKEDLDRELAALPDVSAKMAPREEPPASPDAESGRREAREPRPIG